MPTTTKIEPLTRWKARRQARESVVQRERDELHSVFRRVIAARATGQASTDDELDGFDQAREVFNVAEDQVPKLTKVWREMIAAEQKDVEGKKQRPQLEAKLKEMQQAAVKMENDLIDLKRQCTELGGKMIMSGSLRQECDRMRRESPLLFADLAAFEASLRPRRPVTFTSAGPIERSA